MSVQTLSAEASIEGFDERIVSRFARPTEVERDTIGIGPQIQIARDELGALIDADGLRITNCRAGVLQRLNDILGAVAEARIKHRRVP